MTEGDEGVFIEIPFSKLVVGRWWMDSLADRGMWVDTVSNGLYSVQSIYIAMYLQI